jgi:hypothetical protein
MRTVAELTAAAAQLDREELHELRREIQRLQKGFIRALQLKIDDVSYRLTLVDDSEWKGLLRRSLAIADDPSWDLRLFISLYESGLVLRFIESYLVVAERTGLGVRDGDDWQGGRRFAFAMEVRKRRRRFDYLFEYRQGEGIPSFYLWKVVEPNDPGLVSRHMLVPIAEELSSVEIHKFFEGFHKALREGWAALSRRWRQPFVRRAPDVRLVFGFCDGRFFEDKSATEEEYELACRRWEECVTRAREQWRACRATRPH